MRVLVHGRLDYSRGFLLALENGLNMLHRLRRKELLPGFFANARRHVLDHANPTGMFQCVCDFRLDQ